MAILGSMVRKESLQIWRDKRTLLIVLVMPLVLMLLFGFAISMEVNNVRVAAVVPQHSDRTRNALMRLQVNPYFTFEGLMPVGDIDKVLRSGRADAVVLLDDRGGTLRQQIIADGSNTATAKSVTAYVEGALAESGRNMPVTLRTLYNPQLKSSYNFVPGILGMIFILICAIMTSVSIVGEKERGTMDLLLVSPVRPLAVIIGKLVPYFMLSCILLALMLTLSYTVLGIPFGNLFNIILVSLVYIVLALAVGLLISSMVRTQLAALIASAMIFMIPVIMLSGMIFPIDNMPAILQWLSCIVPARWYISAMRCLMIQQQALSGVWLEMTVLVGMTLVILVLAVRKFYLSTK